MAEIVELDWSSAEVTDGTLVVALTSKPPKKWREAFTRAAALLSLGKWHTRLSEKASAIRLDPVRLGDEERVRQFLEGALLEANRTIVAEGELFEPEPDEQDAEDSEQSSDAQLTQAFRGFALTG